MDVVVRRSVREMVSDSDHVVSTLVSLRSRRACRARNRHQVSLAVAIMPSVGFAILGLPVTQPVFSFSIIHPFIFAALWWRYCVQKVSHIPSPDNAPARKLKVLNTKNSRYRCGGFQRPAFSLRSPLSLSCGPTTLPDSSWTSTVPDSWKTAASKESGVSSGERQCDSRSCPAPSSAQAPGGRVPVLVIDLRSRTSTRCGGRVLLVLVQGIVVCRCIVIIV